MIAPFRSLLDEFRLTIRDFAERFDVPVRTVENWSRGSSGLPEYQLNLFRFALLNGFHKPNFFCGEENCGRSFDLSSPNEPCPFCGSFLIYPNTEEGRRMSISDQADYENALIEWDEE